MAFYIYGAGLLALLTSLPYLTEGTFIQVTVNYFFIKYLSPTSLEQIITQVLVGTGVAGIK
jgi:hypothetical protein